MTITEAVTAQCAVLVNPATVDLEIINAGLDGSATYTAAMREDVAKTACNVLASHLGLSSVKEGDLTYSFDQKGIKDRLAFLSNQFGFTEFTLDEPTISSPKVW